MARTYAALLYEYKQEMAELSDAEFGRLCRALIDYSETGTPIALCGNERFYANRVMAQEDRIRRSYEELANRNKNNGKKGGRPKANPPEPTETQNNPEKPKKTQRNPHEPTETQKTESESESKSESNTPPAIAGGSKGGKPPAPVRRKYGEYSNVLLSESDLDNLKPEFPPDWQERIEHRSGYMASTGKGYKNHLATIRNWARRDAQARGQQPGGEKTAEQKARDAEAAAKQTEWMLNFLANLEGNQVKGGKAE
ncbi:MAG: DUF6291 domain-containing protein [Clostridiales bacterium]|nr:DUF6291 domain-containing protein [Clostridiales bacterium]